MVALKKSVEQILKARGLSEAELSSRLGMSTAELDQKLSDLPKRHETFLGNLSKELSVPDFFLFSEQPLLPDTRFPDFRLATPAPGGYSRATLRWMDLACSVQAEAEAITKTTRPTPTIQKLSLLNAKIPDAANSLREALNLTFENQLAATSASRFFAEVRAKVESLNIFVMQQSFPERDGAGFCLATSSPYDVIVLNTQRQIHARRSFTLAHELYHSVLRQSGVSDPLVIKNDIERRCNQFAAEFIAPAKLVTLVASATIKSRSLNIAELKRFSSTIKLSMYASVLRLVETGHYNEKAIGAWKQFLTSSADPDAPKKGGGGKQEQWKYKLGRYGFKFAEIFGPAHEQGVYDDYELFRLSGIKPKYQNDYLRNALTANPEDATEDGDGAGEDA